MTKKSNQILTAVLLSILLSAIITYATIPRSQVAENPIQQKDIAVLEDVIGLDTTTYTVTGNKQSNNIITGHRQDTTDFNLFADQSSLRVDLSFIDNKFHRIYLHQYVGSPVQKQEETNILDMARSFMTRYQSYTGDSFYSELGALLDGVSLNENIVKIAGNVQLEVSVFGQDYQNLIWTYIDENGVTAPFKNVFLSYAHGKLESFNDNWQFYKIGGTPKISSDEAVAIALKAVEDLFWDAYTDNNELVTVSDFKIVAIGNTSLCYLNYYKSTSSPTRSGDQFILYPAWYVPLGFDDVYPGTVTGATVRVWADTGEVASMSPM
ncbi:hypothetical protein [Candidatus Bathycorpusculum sp.]|uniref:hypothetical protein n=1 Tax=Candidatus Bathycorpusculum sp. TaxID=2994959 RepID=UPI00281CC4A3|nr:hypothetical protein [Candidatus Termitimicrobium sp.]MCL2432720.1 hypothetical protein [Candidatus Termitimicrobium sp.]